jgi:hypothetical protein
MPLGKSACICNGKTVSAMSMKRLVIVPPN